MQLQHLIVIRSTLHIKNSFQVLNLKKLVILISSTRFTPTATTTSSVYNLHYKIIVHAPKCIIQALLLRRREREARGGRLPLFFFKLIFLPIIYYTHTCENVWCSLFAIILLYLSGSETNCCNNYIIYGSQST